MCRTESAARSHRTAEARPLVSLTTQPSRSLPLLPPPVLRESQLPFLFNALPRTLGFRASCLSFKALCGRVANIASQPRIATLTAAKEAGSFKNSCLFLATLAFLQLELSHQSLCRISLSAPPHTHTPWLRAVSLCALHLAALHLLRLTSAHLFFCFVFAFTDMGCGLSRRGPDAAAVSDKHGRQRTMSASPGTPASQPTDAAATPLATPAHKTYARRQLFARTVANPPSTSEDESKPPSVLGNEASPGFLQSVASSDGGNIAHLYSVPSNGFGSFAYSNAFVDLQPAASQSSNTDSKKNAKGAIPSAARLSFTRSATEKTTPADVAGAAVPPSPPAIRELIHSAQRVDLRPQSPVARADAIVGCSTPAQPTVKTAATSRQKKALNSAGAASEAPRRNSSDATVKSGVAMRAAVPHRSPTPPPTVPPGGRLSPLSVRRAPQHLGGSVGATPKPTNTPPPASGNAPRVAPTLSTEYDMRGILTSDEGHMLRSAAAQRRTSVGEVSATSDNASVTWSDPDSPITVSSITRASYGPMLSPSFTMVASNSVGAASFARRGREASQNSIPGRFSPALPGTVSPASLGSVRDSDGQARYSFYADSTEDMKSMKLTTEEHSTRSDNDTATQPHVNNSLTNNVVVPAKRRATHDKLASGANLAAGAEDSDSDSDGPGLVRKSSSDSDVLVGSQMSLLEAAATTRQQRRRMVTIVEPEARPPPATRMPVNLLLVRGMQPMPHAHQPPPHLAQPPQQPTVAPPQSPHAGPSTPRPAQRKLTAPVSHGASLVEASLSPECTSPAPGRRQVASRPHPAAAHTRSRNL